MLRSVHQKRAKPALPRTSTMNWPRNKEKKTSSRNQLLPFCAAQKNNLLISLFFWSLRRWSSRGFGNFCAAQVSLTFHNELELSWDFGHSCARLAFYRSLLFTLSMLVFYSLLGEYLHNSLTDILEEFLLLRGTSASAETLGGKQMHANFLSYSQIEFRVGGKIKRVEPRRDRRKRKSSFPIFDLIGLIFARSWADGTFANGQIFCAFIHSRISSVFVKL